VESKVSAKRERPKTTEGSLSEGEGESGKHGVHESGALVQSPDALRASGGVHQNGSAVLGTAHQKSSISEDDVSTTRAESFERAKPFRDDERPSVSRTTRAAHSEPRDRSRPRASDVLLVSSVS
jgi:hypothetical protein